ncbi:MAG: hypothetical protein BWX88_02898 [Planctomycetes bacterium ADurb.Bin126]|nr:MAG: hypothetical protein BWX88_02898 [Planctomycetes bacterium ADurb.Bin126]
MLPWIKTVCLLQCASLLASCAMFPGQPTKFGHKPVLGDAIWKFEPDWKPFMSSPAYDLCIRYAPGTFINRRQLVVTYELFPGADAEMLASVETVNDLAGDMASFVTIDDPDKALSFVRLRTSHATRDVSTFRDWIGWEIFSGGRVGPGAGMISQDQLLLAKWKPATVKKDGDRWVVVRQVLRPSASNFLAWDRISELTEEVSIQGMYTLLRERDVLSADFPNILLFGVPSSVPP